MNSLKLRFKSNIFTPRGKYNRQRTSLPHRRESSARDSLFLEISKPKSPSEIVIRTPHKGGDPDKQSTPADCKGSTNSVIDDCVQGNTKNPYFVRQREPHWYQSKCMPRFSCIIQYRRKQQAYVKGNGSHGTGDCVAWAPPTLWRVALPCDTSVVILMFEIQRRSVQVSVYACQDDTHDE